MKEATRYLSTVAWETWCKGVILLTDATVNVPATFRVSVYPKDLTQPSAGLVEIGFYLKDDVGHTFSVIQTGAGTIDVADDFRCNYAPASNQVGVVYKSAGRGNSPYLAPIYYKHLDKIALDYSRQFELDILWKNDPNAIDIVLEPTQTPLIVDYQLDRLDGSNLAEDYGENASFTLFQQLSVTQKIERTEKPNITYVGGLIDSISFGDLWEVQSGLIIKISKS